MSSKRRDDELALAVSDSAATSSSKSNSRHRLSQYEERVSGVSQVDREQTIPALALRAYHLPGNSWCDDWIQYFANNHPIFGICFHDKLHPVKPCMRIINLVGSIVFGLAVTNIVWLWLIDNRDESERPVLTLSLGGFSVGNTTGGVDFDNGNMRKSRQEIEITQGMVLLWTVGGCLHALYDNTVWCMTACVCCLPGRSLHCLGRFRGCGSYLVIFTVVASAAFASFLVVLRAALDDSEDSVSLSDLNTGGITDDKVDLDDAVDDASAYEFLISYAVELFLALTVYYQVIGTILFSGILGCGRVPVLGGRPYEVMLEERLSKRQESWVTTPPSSSSSGGGTPAPPV